MRLFRKGSYANITATAALVVALGGTSYAAGLITSAQIKNGTVASIDVKNGTLSNKDLSPKARTAAYSTFHDSGVAITNQVSGQDPTVLSLNVPAGSYVFQATTYLWNSGGAAVLARCILRAGGDFDDKRTALEAAAAANANYAVVASQVVHTFTSPGVAKFSCYTFGITATANQTKLTAIRVANLSNAAG